VEISRAEAARAQAQAEQARHEAEKAIAEAIATAAQAQARIGFITGLMCGPALLGAGAAIFLALRRRNRLRLATSKVAGLDGIAEPRTLGLQH
jgi:phosphotransferase system  glucose/maltose/N-acetylglucosamine-specific IIC component